MTETRAAYEAATLEAMHTGDYTAPDMEYTPIPDPLPRLVRREELDAMRGERDSLGIECALLRAERDQLRGIRDSLELRVRELDACIAAVPSGGLIDYYYGSGALSYDAREARPVVGAWIRRLEDENAAAMRGEVRP